MMQDMREARKKVEAKAEALHEAAMDLTLGMSDQDSMYDLTYIRTKLAQATSHIEKLSDILMELTKISLNVTNMVGQGKALLRVRETELKETEEFKELSRHEKTAWLTSQLQDEREENEAWMLLYRMVSTVKDSVSDRAQTMKRLDSDIRLHAKLYEQGVASGATSPTSYKGSNTTEIDL